MNAPGTFAKLARCGSLAFIDGAVSRPFARLAGFAVDLVAVDWRAVARQIVSHLSECERRAGEPACFEAAALFEVPLSRHAQRLVAA